MLIKLVQLIDVQSMVRFRLCNSWNGSKCKKCASFFWSTLFLEMRDCNTIMHLICIYSNKHLRVLQFTSPENDVFQLCEIRKIICILKPFWTLFLIKRTGFYSRWDIYYNRHCVSIFIAEKYTDDKKKHFSHIKWAIFCKLIFFTEFTISCFDLP